MAAYIPSECESCANIVSKMSLICGGVAGLIDQNAKQRLYQRQWIPADCGKPAAITTTGCEASLNLKITAAMNRLKKLQPGRLGHDTLAIAMVSKSRYMKATGKLRKRLKELRSVIYDANT